jgi:hypothetical protein
MSLAWVIVIVLVVAMLAWAAALFLLLAMGRATLDLGWGRSFHPLGPLTVRIDAPREMVFEMISAPYAGRASGGSGIELLAHDESLAVAAHHTKVHFYTARTVEVVDLESPRRVGFRHLTGPVPYAVEQFVLEEREGATELSYDGQLGIDFFWLGRLAARHWVRPQWQATVAAHLDDLTRRAEERASRSGRRRRGG